MYILSIQPICDIKENEDKNEQITMENQPDNNNEVIADFHREVFKAYLREGRSISFNDYIEMCRTYGRLRTK